MGEIAGGLKIGQHFGKYEIVALLGQGGMGAVYEARHRDLRKKVAIKTLLPALAAVPEARARFLREGEAASRIRHPHVVDVTDVGEYDGIPFLVMEFLEGTSLADRVSGRGAMTVEEVIAILLPVIAAVAAAHDDGVIHRDLKPSNIFLARDRMGDVVPKVLDFGVSKVSFSANSEVLTGTLSVVGTASYMSPEQAAGSKSVGPASDQYALGLVAYEALTGRRVHDGDNPLAIINDVLTGQIPPPRSVRADLPEGLDSVLMRALSRQSASRFPHLTDFARALLPFASERTRLIWSERLESRPVREDVHAPDRSAQPVTAAAGSASSVSGAGATKLLPASGAVSGALPNPTTLRHAAAERTDDAPEASVPKRRWILPAGLAAAIVVVALFAWPHRPEAPSSRLPEQTPPRPTFSVSVSVSPETASLTLDGEPAGASPLKRELPRDARDHILVIAADGWRSETLRFSEKSPPPARIELSRVVVEAPLARVAPGAELAPAAAVNERTASERPRAARAGRATRPATGPKGSEAQGGPRTSAGTQNAPQDPTLIPPPIEPPKVPMDGGKAGQRKVKMW